MESQVAWQAVPGDVVDVVEVAVGAELREVSPEVEALLAPCELVVSAATSARPPSAPATSSAASPPQLPATIVAIARERSACMACFIVEPFPMGAPPSLPRPSPANYGTESFKGFR
jgi:hypothetical protein